MIGWIGTIGEALGIVRAVVDPDKKVTSYRLRHWKKQDKAIEAAEEMFRGLDKFFSGGLSKDKTKYLYKRSSKIFWANNN